MIPRLTILAALALVPMVAWGQSGGQELSSPFTTNKSTLATVTIPSTLTITGQYGDVTINLGSSPMTIDTHGQLLSDAARAFWSAVAHVAPVIALADCTPLPEVSASPALQPGEAVLVTDGKAQKCRVVR